MLKQEYFHYIIVSPYNKKYRCGISVYTHNLYNQLLKIPNITPIILENKKNLSIENFKKSVLKYIQKNCDPKNTIIECPENYAICIDLPKNFIIHVRLHCPSILSQSLSGQKLNVKQIQNELLMLNRANIISSPSQHLISEMQKYFNIPPSLNKKIIIYPNPLDENITQYLTKTKERKYDLCFIANFASIKGIENLNRVLENLPSHYSVIICGKDANLFKFSKKIQCHLKVHSHITKKETIYKILANSKAFLNLSKFESFGFSMFEALALKTIIVGLNAPALKEYYSINSLSENIDDIPNQIYLNHSEYEFSIQNINTQFLNGIQAIIKNNLTTTKYNNIAYINLHNKKTNIIFNIPRYFGASYKLQRKWQKFLHSPNLFFYDMLHNFIKKFEKEKPLKNMTNIQNEIMNLISKTENKEKAITPEKINNTINNIQSQPKNTKIEPREFAIIRGSNEIEIFSKSIKNLPYSSILFLENDYQSLIHNKFASQLLQNKNSMPLREKTLFFLKYEKSTENYDFFANYHNIIQFRQNLLKSNFNQIKTFYFINPIGTMPFFFRSLFVNSRIVLFVDQQLSLEYISQRKDEIDILVAEENLLKTYNPSHIRRIVPFQGELHEKISTIIHKLSIENAPRETEILMPVYGKCNYLPEIHEYNTLLENHLLDGIIILKNPHTISHENKTNTFQNIIESLKDNINSILLSENTMFRYKTLIIKNDIQNLLSYIFADNLRIKIIHQ